MTRMLSVVLVGILLSSKSLQAFHNSLTSFQPTRAIVSHERYISSKTLANDQQPTLSHTLSRSFALLGTNNGEDDSKADKIGAKAKRKLRAKGEIMRYNDEIAKPWSLSDSFNSTTMKFLFEFKDEVSGTWAKVERKFASWILVVTSKVERDIKTTFKTGDFVTRKIKKETKAVFSGVAEASKPFLALPATVQRLSSKKDSWDMIRIGMNPLGEERMLGNFNAKNTKERASAPKKKPVPILAVDSVYRSVRVLPNKLKYDYNRKKVAQEVERNDREMLRQNLLSDGNDDDDDAVRDRERSRSARMPLLAEYSSSLEQEDQFISSDSDPYPYPDLDLDPDSDEFYSAASGQPFTSAQPEMPLVVTEEEGRASLDVLDRLRAFSSAVKEGALEALKTELVWALSEARETLDLEFLEFKASPSNEGEVVVETDGSEVKGTNADERDLRQWGVERVTVAIETLSAAAAVCDRLESLPLQILEIDKMGGSERTLELRTGDFIVLRKGVETFVEGMPAAKDSAGAGAGAGVGVGVGGSYMTGWGRGQKGVVERIMGNRALLAGVYSLTEGLEDVIDQQRGLMTQRRRGAGRTSVREREEQGAVRGEYAAGSQDVGAKSVSVDEVPEGLLKETVSAPSQQDVGVIVEEERMEKKAVVSVPKAPSQTWSPGATVMKVPSAESEAVPDPSIGIKPQTSSAHVSESSTSSSTTADVNLSDRNSDDSEGQSEVGEKVGEQFSTSVPDPAESSEENATKKEKESEVLRTELFFLSVVDDFAYVGDSYTRSNSADDDSRGDSRVFDTTVESSERDSEKVFLFLAASLDVMFFLVETIVKTAGPILAGGGALAADRAAEALFSDTVSPDKFLRSKTRLRETVGSDAGKQGRDTWKLLSEFKKQM